MPAVERFIFDLKSQTSQPGASTYEFHDARKNPRGVLQLGRCENCQISIHRIWTHDPGKGHGSFILKTLCDLADRHVVILTLKATPFGPRPYPMSRESIKKWYQRHQFTGPGWKLSRQPSAAFHLCR